MTMPEPRELGQPAGDERERARWGPVDKSPERSIELTIPARPELWGLARMTVASVASRLGFVFEEIEDLRLAVDELSIACARETSPASVLQLRCHWSGASLYLECKVAPVYGEGNDDEKLRNATLNSLERASEKAMKSIAFPAISTGIFGFPKDRCARIMLNTISEFLANRQTSLEKVILCLWSLDDLDLFSKTLAEVNITC